MSLTGFFYRKNITDDCYEHDKAEIEKVLHEINFEYNTTEHNASEGKTKCWYVRDGSSYIDEDGEEWFRSFNINLVQHIDSWRVENIQNSPYIRNIYFECFRDGYGDPGAWDLLLIFLHKYFEYYPDCYFMVEGHYYSKSYIDEKYDSGNLNEWC